MRIFTIVTLLNKSQSGGDDSIWRTGIVISHTAYLILMLIFGVFSYVLKSKNKANLTMAVVENAVVIVTLFISTLITLVDQLVTYSIIPFLIACIAVGAIFIIRPINSLLTFLSGYTLYYFGMGFVQPDPAVLLSNRINGLTSIILGIFLSFVLWRSTVVNLQQKRHIMSQQRELEVKNERLQYLASTDPLTGLLNRRHFDERVSFEISRIKRYGNKSSLLIADIDNFKDVNDNFGHPSGDALLEEFAIMLKRQLRETDIVARIGGEEFAILLTDTDGPRGRIVAEKIRENMEEKTFVLDGLRINITVSIGVASLDNRINSYEEVYRHADRALYAAKSKGKNRVDYSV